MRQATPTTGTSRRPEEPGHDPVGEIVGVAFQSIRANKLRSFLTMLGIIIGVGAVITMVALGTGAQKAVKDAHLGAGRQPVERCTPARRSPAASRRRTG